ARTVLALSPRSVTSWERNRSISRRSSMPPSSRIEVPSDGIRAASAEVRGLLDVEGRGLAGEHLETLFGSHRLDLGPMLGGEAGDLGRIADRDDRVDDAVLIDVHQVEGLPEVDPG